MKNSNGHRKLRATSYVEAQGVANSMEQFQILRTSISDADGRGLFLNLKRDLRHGFSFQSFTAAIAQYLST